MFASFSYPILLPKYWQVADRAEKKYERADLLFHLSKNDYFGTLATKLHLMEELIKDKDFSAEKQKWKIQTLKREIENLLFLQKNYKIVFKKSGKKQ